MKEEILFRNYQTGEFRSCSVKSLYEYMNACYEKAYSVDDEKLEMLVHIVDRRITFSYWNRRVSIKKCNDCFWIEASIIGKTLRQCRNKYFQLSPISLDCRENLHWFIWIGKHLGIDFESYTEHKDCTFTSIPLNTNIP